MASFWRFINKLDNFFSVFRNNRVLRLKKGATTDYDKAFFLARGRAEIDRPGKEKEKEENVYESREGNKENIPEIADAPTLVLNRTREKFLFKILEDSIFLMFDQLDVAKIDSALKQTQGNSNIMNFFDNDITGQKSPLVTEGLGQVNPLRETLILRNE